VKIADERREHSRQAGRQATSSSKQQSATATGAVSASASAIGRRPLALLPLKNCSFVRALSFANL